MQYYDRAKSMSTGSRRVFYIQVRDWTWWAWTITTALLIIGLAGHAWAFVAAMGVTTGQLIIVVVRRAGGFAIQLRVAYLLLLMISFPPPMRWLYWLPTVGTFALIVFGYCLLARFLSLLPWNSREPYTLARLRRTFFSAPDLDRVIDPVTGLGCAGGLCTIEAQVARAGAHPKYDSREQCEDILPPTCG